jgi:hypothetical protein
MLSARRSVVVLTLVGLVACSSASNAPDEVGAAGADLGGSSPPPGVVGLPVFPDAQPFDAHLPPPPPPPPPCEGGGFANANGVCSPDTEMLTTAENACALAKLLLSTFSPDERCGKGSSNAATYTCCHPMPPPPPPPTCFSGGGANANGVCSPDAELKLSAEQACAAEHTVLTSFVPNEKCGPGSSDAFTYTCCPLAVPDAGKASDGGGVGEAGPAR